MEKASTHIKIDHSVIKIITSSDYEYTKETLYSLADTILKEAQLNVVEKCYYAYPVQGETLVYILSESSLVLHTWPEHSFIYVDLLTGNTNLKYDQIEKAIRGLKGIVSIQSQEVSNQVL